MSSALSESRAATTSALRHVVILADESANWKVAGLRQLDRLLLCLEEFAANEEESLAVRIFWQPGILPNEQLRPDETRFAHLELEQDADATRPVDLLLSTRLFLHRHSIPQWHALAPNEQLSLQAGDASWEILFADFQNGMAKRWDANDDDSPWYYLADACEIGVCERRFLAESGKSQDGLVSRYVNRPLSRALSRWLLKLPIRPTTWSLGIFILPLVACGFFLRGTTIGFIIGCAIFQLYSILDGCDGEIARAKFLQSESGRRIDSFCDLLGNILLALSLGIGLTRQVLAEGETGWYFAAEGIIAALLILLSEGIVFLRRARPENEPVPTKWNGALYQRHHELFARSGILLLGNKVAWFVVQFTKRDMAMLGFLALASLGWTEWILHLQVLVSGISSALAWNVFLRPAPVILSEEAS